MNKIILFLCCVCLLSCKKGGQNNNTQSVNTVAQKDSIKQNKVIVLKDATKFAEKWPSLLDFETELINIGKNEIISEKQLEQLINLLAELKKSIPEKFKQPAINARIIVLETDLLLMNQFVKEINEEEASNQYLKLQKAYNVLINQLEALLTKEKDYEKYK